MALMNIHRYMTVAMTTKWKPKQAHNGQSNGVYETYFVLPTLTHIQVRDNHIQYIPPAL